MNKYKYPIQVIQTKECVGWRVKYKPTKQFVEVRCDAVDDRMIHYFTNNEPLPVSEDDAYLRKVRFLDQKSAAAIKGDDLILEPVFRRCSPHEITVNTLEALMVTLSQHTGYAIGYDPDAHLATSQEQIKAKFELIERILKSVERK